MVSFVKMHGLGNDFVVLDGRGATLALTPERLRRLADRRGGIGCDQVMVIDPPKEKVFPLRIYNSDGGAVGACGNGTRCVAALLMDEFQKTHIHLETPAGPVEARQASNPALITVDMGKARDDWRDIPLAAATDTLHLPLSIGPLSDGVAVSMGNPHVVFFVNDTAPIDLPHWGSLVEHDPLFPERVNVGVVQILAPDHLQLRVWERGAGLTEACGTGACAAVVAAARRGLAHRACRVSLDGGDLEIAWLENGHVEMTGPVTTVYRGEIDLETL